MGQMRFLTPDNCRLSAWQTECAYLAGMDGMPWRSHNHRQDGKLILEREIADSGHLSIPWESPVLGNQVLCSASLRESGETYLLPLEIARGTVNLLRCQKADWELAGLNSNPEITLATQEATALFVEAATKQYVDVNAASDLSLQAIDKASETIGALSRFYAKQAIAMRRGDGNRLPTLMACSLDRLPKDEQINQQLGRVFNSASLQFRWKDIEPNAGECQWDEVDQQINWCQEMGLRICVGPLICLDRLSLPDWLYLWEDDFDQLASFLLQFVSNVVNRYKGRVHLWQCSSALNLGGEIGLSEEQRLRLAVAAIELVRRLSPETPVVTNFDQPWGEYLAKQDMELSPLQFADTLLRANLGLAGVGMELNLGYSPSGTLPRNPLALSRLIDRWSILGVPLLVVLSCPSSTEADPDADPRVQNIAGSNLQDRVGDWIEVLLAKPAVHGVIWNQLTDSGPHRYPHAGLLDADFQPKPALEKIAAIRREHLL